MEQASPVVSLWTFDIADAVDNGKTLPTSLHNLYKLFKEDADIIKIQRYLNSLKPLESENLLKEYKINKQNNVPLDHYSPYLLFFLLNLDDYCSSKKINLTSQQINEVKRVMNNKRGQTSVSLIENNLIKKILLFEEFKRRTFALAN